MKRIPFNQEEVSRWFGDCYECWWCGENGWDAGHHINNHNKYNDSLLNYAPLHNHKCHIDIHPKLKRRENVEKLLQKTMSYLLSEGYEFNDTDRMFVSENREYYIKQV